MKLDQIVENQEELLGHHRRLTVSGTAASLDDIEDKVRNPCRSVEDLLALCEKLEEEDEFRKSLVRVFWFNSYTCTLYTVTN